MYALVLQLHISAYSALSLAWKPEFPSSAIGTESREAADSDVGKGKFSKSRGGTQG